MIYGRARILNPKIQERILKHIPYQGKSSLIKGRSGYEVTIEGERIEKEKEKKKLWNF